MLFYKGNLLRGVEGKVMLEYLALRVGFGMALNPWAMKRNATQFGMSIEKSSFQLEIVGARISKCTTNVSYLPRKKVSEASNLGPRTSSGRITPRGLFLTGVRCYDGVMFRCLVTVFFRVDGLAVPTMGPGDSPMLYVEYKKYSWDDSPLVGNYRSTPL